MIGPLLRCLWALPLALMISFSCGAQASDQMVFKLEAAQEPAQVFGTAWTIYADGVIDDGAGSRLAKAISDNRVPRRSFIYLNSPGGSLRGGMILGGAIRDAGLMTYVGQDSGQLWPKNKGECYSACVLAYIGGEYRFLPKGSLIGVHRFYSNDDVSSDDAQIVSAALIQYIRDMGVDPALFNEMTEAGANEINVLSRNDLVHLNVVNYGFGPTRWTMESVERTVYLKGERDTFRGINKFILACPPDGRRIDLYVIFDPQGREQEVLGMHAQSLAIDGKALPIHDLLYQGPEVVNGWINAWYSLNGTTLQAIQHARTVGIMFQHAYEAPVFLGFSDMDFREGANKLPGFMAVCLK